MGISVLYEDMVNIMRIKIVDNMFQVMVGSKKIINIKVLYSSTSAMRISPFGEQHFRMPRILDVNTVLDDLNRPFAKKRLALLIIKKHVLKNELDGDVFINQFKEEGKIALLGKIYKLQFEYSFRNYIILSDEALLILRKKNQDVSDIAELVLQWRKNFFKNTVDSIIKELALECKKIGFKPFKYYISCAKNKPVWGLENYSKIMISINCIKIEKKVLSQMIIFFSYLMQGYTRVIAAEKCRRIFDDFEYANIIYGLQCRDQQMTFSYYFITNTSEDKSTAEHVAYKHFRKLGLTQGDSTSGRSDKCISNHRLERAAMHSKRVKMLHDIKNSKSP